MMLRVGACALLLGATASAALAHHSFAMFDRAKVVTLSGEVKSFEMINPHGWLRVAVMQQGAAPGQEWALEMGPPGVLQREGWTAQSIQAGEAVTVRLHPMKDGSNAGQLMSVKLASGKTLLGGPGRGFSDER